jgi:hypothetical protein
VFIAFSATYGELSAQSGYLKAKLDVSERLSACGGATSNQIQLGLVQPRKVATLGQPSKIVIAIFENVGVEKSDRQEYISLDS